MNMKEKFLNATVDSIKFKLIIAIVIVQCFSSYIGQGVNLVIARGRDALQGVGVPTFVLDGAIGVFISAAISIIISVFIIVYICLILKSIYL